MPYLPLVLAFWFMILGTLCAILYALGSETVTEDCQASDTHDVVATSQQDTENHERRCRDALRQCASDVFACPCGKSYKQAIKYHAHQDKCWAWGHYDGLRMALNKLGGCQTKGDRYMMPKSSKLRSTIDKANVCPMPTYPNYNKWKATTHHAIGRLLLVSAEWFANHKDYDFEPSIEVKFNPNGANRPVSLTDLAEMYPKMVKKFGDVIKIT